MRRFTRTDEQLEQWIKMEHYRLHCAKRRPDSGYKEAVLAAIRSTLNTLEPGLCTKSAFGALAPLG